MKWGFIVPEGLGLEIKTFSFTKNKHTLCENMLSFEKRMPKNLGSRSVIFIPAAASRIVSAEQVEKLKIMVSALWCHVPIQ